MIPMNKEKTIDTTDDYKEVLKTLVKDHEDIMETLNRLHRKSTSGKIEEYDADVSF